MTLTGSHLSGNMAGGLGGAIYSTGTPASATFTSSTVKTNAANQGAGIASVNGTLTLTSSVVTTNAATVNPGGIYYVASSATLNTSTVTANTPTNCTGSPSPCLAASGNPTATLVWSGVLGTVTGPRTPRQTTRSAAVRARMPCSLVSLPASPS